MLMHFISNKEVIVHKKTSEEFKKQLTDIGLKVMESFSALPSEYPGDIILNAVNTSSHFIHRLASTDKVLLEYVNNKKLINVKQGYTKCSTAVINDNAFITSDKCIYEALTKEGLDVLMVPAGGIELPDLDYGFIGGTCGALNNKTMVFYGDIQCYPYKEQVLSYLRQHNIEAVSLGDGPLIDRGSIFFIET